MTCLLILLDDPLPAELQSRAEQFKVAINQLVDLLDLNHPSTVKLKVCSYRYHVYTFFVITATKYFLTSLSVIIMLFLYYYCGTEIMLPCGDAESFADVCTIHFFLMQRLVNSLSHQSLPDVFTGIVHSSFEEKLKVLDAVDLPERFDAAQALIQRQITVGEVTECFLLLREIFNSVD